MRLDPGVGIRTSEPTFMAGKFLNFLVPQQQRVKATEQYKLLSVRFVSSNETILLAVHDLFSSQEAILNSQEQKYGCVGAFCQFNETILLAVHDLFSSQEAILNSQEQK